MSIKQETQFNGSLTKASKPKQQPDMDDGKPSAAQKLLSLLIVLVELFKGIKEGCYISPLNTGNPYVIEIESPLFKHWFDFECYQQAMYPSDSLSKQVKSILLSKAKFEGDDIKVYRRMAPLEQGVEIDVGNDQHERIIVDATKGVTLIKTGSSNYFARSAYSKQTPQWVATGDWSRILPYLNLKHNAEMLMVATILYLMCTPVKKDIAYPHLQLLGPQGTGKSVLCEQILQPLIDPSSLTNLRFPSDDKDLTVMMEHSHLLIFDNIRDKL